MGEYISKVQQRPLCSNPICLDEVHSRTDVKLVKTAAFCKRKIGQNIHGEGIAFRK